LKLILKTGVKSVFENQIYFDTHKTKFILLP